MSCGAMVCTPMVCWGGFSLLSRFECHTQSRSAAIVSSERPVATLRGLSLTTPSPLLRQGLVVALLDQQPILAPLIGGLSSHAYQRPFAVQLFAFQLEFEGTLAVCRVGVGVRGDPGAAIPQQHRAAAVFALRNNSLELTVIERVVLDMDRQSLFSRIEARPLGHRPALQDAVELEAEIIMEPARRMLLDDKAEPGDGFLRGRDTRRLRRFAEVPFASVFLERHAAQPDSPAIFGGRSETYCSATQGIKAAASRIAGSPGHRSLYVHIELTRRG